MNRTRQRAAAAAAAGAGGVLGLALTAAPWPVLFGVVLAAAAAFLLLSSLRALWAWALLLFAVLPVSYLPVPDLVLTITPSALILGVLGVRLLLRGSGPPRVVLGPAALLVVAFAGWLAVAVAASDYRAVSLGWFVSFGLLVVLPALLATGDRQVRDVLRTTWIVLGALLGAYALVETFLLQANPLLDPLYAQASRGSLVQKWSVYRATTTLGHPVNNGSFFAVAVPLALGTAIYRRSVAATAAVLLAAGGVVASGSRSAFAAMLVGAAVVVLLPAPRSSHRGSSTTVRAVGAVAILLVLVVGWAYLSTRDASVEGARSATFRTTQVPLALDSVSQAPWLGTGPGAASLSQESLLARIGGAGAFESYWLELVVAAGVPGLLLGVAVVLAALVTAARSGAPEVAGAVIAWAISVSFVNAFEGGRPELLLLGLLLALALAGSSARVPPQRPPTRGTQRAAALEPGIAA